MIFKKKGKWYLIEQIILKTVNNFIIRMVILDLLFLMFSQIFIQGFLRKLYYLSVKHGPFVAFLLVFIPLSSNIPQANRKSQIFQPVGSPLAILTIHEFFLFARFRYLDSYVSINHKHDRVYVMILLTWNHFSNRKCFLLFGDDELNEGSYCWSVFEIILHLYDSQSPSILRFH